ncbi:MAG TPA: DUF2953 domain-containing protein [Firmicutes bacterium]|nr:DUF2953 domain-containing protein [Bacillota bacterium]
MLLLGLFLFFLFFLLLIKFSLKIQLGWDGEQLSITLSLALCGIFFKIPPVLLAKAAEKIRERPFPRLQEARRGLHLASRLFSRFVQEVNAFDLKIVFGAGDPLWTALGFGGIWAVLGPLFGGRAKLAKPPRIDVTPDFHNRVLRISLYCIFSFRLGQIILDELRALVRS